MELAAAVRSFEPQQPGIVFGNGRPNGLPLLETIERAMADQFCEPIKKLCKICGDRAAYHNYGVLTCDSCKTFFRRQIIDKKVCSRFPILKKEVLLNRVCYERTSVQVG